MRLAICIGLIGLLCGCASQPITAYFTPEDEQLFVRGLDDATPDGGPPAAFATLETAYPDSPWAGKARRISALLTTIATQQKTIAQLTRDSKTFKRDNAVLRKKIQSLESDRQKLRLLLIDMERRGR